MDNFEDNIPVKGAGFHVAYTGLEIISTSDKVKILGKDGLQDYDPNK
jgi:hypothetical protein